MCCSSGAKIENLSSLSCKGQVFKEFSFLDLISKVLGRSSSAMIWYLLAPKQAFLYLNCALHIG